MVDRGTGMAPTGTQVGTQLRSLQKRLLALQRDAQLLERQAINTTMGEAAESSIMEGAATTLARALDMLRSGRPPRTVGERMVMNNYFAMQQIKQWLDRPLSIEMLLEIQELLTEGTLDEPGGVGRLRADSDLVRIVDTRNNETIFTPPPVGFLGGLLRSACEFANKDHTGPEFIHPIVKATILHFLIGYAHPFVDGNGRTARAVFYWFALRHGYGVFEFLSISEIIRKGYAKYPQAYLDSELDDGDLTYFVLYHLDAIQQALDRLAEHVEREQERTRRSEPLLKLAKDLNLRQRLLLEHALRHPLTQYTVKSHMNSNGIVAATSRADLDDLVRRRLMVTSKKGKQVLYLIAPGLEDRLNRRSAK
jgi:Fic family protein